MTFPFYIGILGNDDSIGLPTDSSVGLDEGGYLGSLEESGQEFYKAVGYWPLNSIDEYNDLTQFGLNLTPINSPTTNDKYAIFNGTNYLEGESTILYDTADQLSVIGTFKRDTNTVSSSETLIAKAGITGQSSFAIVLGTNRKLSLLVSEDGTDIEIAEADYVINCTVETTFCVTFNSGTTSIYINNIEQALTDGITTITYIHDSTSKLYLGYDGVGSYFSGYLRDVSVYKRELLAQEIADITGAAVESAGSYETTANSITDSNPVHFTLDDLNAAIDVNPYYTEQNGSYSLQVYNSTHTNTAISGSAIVFDGSTTRGYLDNLHTLQNSSFSISAWIYINEFPTTGSSIFSNTIVGKSDTNEDYFIGLHLYPAWNTSSFKVHVIGANIALGNSSINYVHSFSVDEIVGLHTWYHIVMVCSYETGELLLYIDSQKQSQNGTFATTETHKLDYTEGWHVGNIVNGSTEGWFNGVIDELTFYDKALSSSEVSKLYLEGNLPDTVSPGFQIPTTSYYENITQFYPSIYYTLDNELIDENNSVLATSNNTSFVVDSPINDTTYSISMSSGNIDISGIIPYIDNQTLSTMVLWFKLNTSGVQPLIYSGNSSGSSYLYVYSDSVNIIGYKVVSDGEVISELRFSLPSTILADNKWHNIVITTNSIQLDIYVDSKLQASSVANTDYFIDVEQDNFYLGYNPQTIEYFDGLLSNFSINEVFVNMDEVSYYIYRYLKDISALDTIATNIVSGSPINFWPFENTISDIYGIANFTSIGGFTLGDSITRDSSSNIYLPENTYLHTGTVDTTFVSSSWTVVGTFRLDVDLTGEQYIASLSSSDSGTDSIKVYKNGTDNIEARIRLSTDSLITLTCANTLSTGVTYSFALVFDGSEYKLYENSEEVDNNVTSTAVKTISGDLYIGAKSDSGTITDKSSLSVSSFALYSTDLYFSIIGDITASGTPYDDVILADNPLAYYKMTETF